MNARYHRQRVAILGAFAALTATAMLTNYAHRNIAGAMGNTGWIAPDVTLLVVLLFLVAAIVFRARWLQWVTALLLLFVEVLFISYRAPG